MTGELSDATALIYLAKADAFADAARIVGRLVVAPAVWAEAVENGRRRGYDDAAVIESARDDGHVAIVDLDGAAARNREHLVRRARLGPGESETIALALATTGRAIVDDRAARRAASLLGVVTMPTIELAVLARTLGVMETADARGLLRRLAAVAPVKAATMLEYERALEATDDGH